MPCNNSALHAEVVPAGGRHQPFIAPPSPGVVSLSRDNSMVECQPHKLNAASSILAPATNSKLNTFIAGTASHARHADKRVSGVPTTPLDCDPEKSPRPLKADPHASETNTTASREAFTGNSSVQVTSSHAGLKPPRQPAAPVQNDRRQVTQNLTVERYARPLDNVNRY